MIEAVMCGTPVVADRRGSVPEVVDDGVRGFIVESAEEAVAVVSEVAHLDRRTTRRRFEERFSARRELRRSLPDPERWRFRRTQGRSAAGT
jgi:glycosyltransferase involved in cell wall biosynthesis